MNDCQYRDFTSPQAEADFWAIHNWIFEVRKAIKTDRSIKEGYGCYSCHLPMKLCPEPHGVERAGIGQSGCEWGNILLEFNVLILFLHGANRYRLQYSRIRNAKEHARALVAPKMIYNTECIQGVIWLWEFDWNEWI